MKRLIVVLGVIVPMYSHAVQINGKITIHNKNQRGQLVDASHAVVYLDGVTKRLPQSNVLMIQKKKAFTPRVLPIVIGQRVDFLNKDKVQHNVFSTDADFDLGRYPFGKKKQVIFDKVGRYKIYCNIHQKMISDVIVLANPYFSLTNAQGHYAINAPAGAYEIKVWHIHGGETAKKIMLTQQAEAINFNITSTKVVRDIRRHKNKHGRTYRSFDQDDFY